MNHLEAVRRCIEELRVNGLTDWGVILSKSRYWYGLCVYEPKRIELSMPFLDVASDNEVVEVIKHEVGHAIAGNEAAHSGKWMNATARIGGNPSRCSPVKLKPRWNIHCEECGELMRGWNVQKDLSGYTCCKCRGKNLVYWPS